MRLYAKNETKLFNLKARHNRYRDENLRVWIIQNKRNNVIDKV